MLQSDCTKFEIGLNIHLLSFSLPKDVIKNNDDVRVSITSMPDEVKQHFHLKGKKMNCTNHVFSLNITNQTKNIVMVFRRKTFLAEDPIIASCTIHMKDFPTLPQNSEQLCSGISTTDVKIYDIYYPLQKQLKEMYPQPTYGNHPTVQPPSKKIKRKVLGQMEIQLSFSTPYSLIKNKKGKISKNNNANYGKVKHSNNDYEKIENDDDNNNLLD